MDTTVPVHYQEYINVVNVVMARTAKSSCRLFWRGVPVKMSEYVALILFTARLTKECSFFILCPSSSTKQRHTTSRTKKCSKEPDRT